MDQDATEPSEPEIDVHESWHVFRLYVEFSRNFNKVYNLGGMKPAPNPLESRFLPTLLFIQLVSLLDEALEDYRELQGTVFGSKKKQDLYHRIELLQERLLDPASLHALRIKRGDLAHQATAFVDWPSLDQAIARVEAELVNLGLVRDSGEYAFFAERSGVLPPNDPAQRFKFEYKTGVTRNGRPGLEYTWTETVLRG